MKVAILGAGNCYALNLATLLHAAGIECFGIGRSPKKAPAFWQAPEGYNYTQADLNLHPFIYADIFDRERPDIIVNFAAQGEGAASFGANAPDFYHTNCTGLASLVESLRGKSWLRQFIHISTSELYGSTDAPATEESPLRPSSPYAISKAAFDQHLQVMHRIHGFPMTIVRPSNCYCPGQQLHRIIPKAIICARTGRKLPLEGGGAARKGYLHADDLSAAIRLLMNVNAIGKTFNVGSDSAISIGHLVYHIANVCDVLIDDLVEVVPDRVGQDRVYKLDSSAIKQSFGWRPETLLPMGLLSMVEWIDRHPELLTMDTGYVHKQ